MSTDTIEQRTPAAWRFKWKGAGGFSVTNDAKYVANLPADALEILPEPLYTQDELPPCKSVEWLSIPAELNDDVRWILGRPNFACSSVAEYLRSRGQEIPHKAEAEQAAVIHWLLKQYVRDGLDWRVRLFNGIPTTKRESP